MKRVNDDPVRLSHEWLPAFVKQPGHRAAMLGDLSVEQRRVLLEEILAHFDVHVAEGHLGAAHECLYLGSKVAGDDPELFYRLERKRITWLDSQGLHGKAIEAMRALFERWRRSRKNPMRGAELAMELGILLDRSGFKKEALKLFRSAIGRYSRMGHDYNQAAAWFNVASVLYDLHRIPQSIKACQRSLEEGGAGRLDLETHIALQLANSHESQADEARAQADRPAAEQQDARAREHYGCAADGYARLNNRKQESNILYRLGWMAMRRGFFREANRFLERALELKREHDYGTGLAYYHFHLAECYRAVRHAARASHHYRHALSLAAAVGNASLSKRSRFGIYGLARDQGRPLTDYLRAAPPEGGQQALQKGKNGLYSDQARDGYRTGLWKSSAEAPIRDRTFLYRLLEDLSRVWKNTQVPGYEQLRQQGQAVRVWQSRIRSGHDR